MYLNEDTFKNYFGYSFKGTSYVATEDLAVEILKEYAGQFPTESEFKALDEEIQSYLTKAILYEVKFIDDNQDYFFNQYEDVTSVSLGRYSTSFGTSNTKREPVKSKFDGSAIRFLKSSGIVITKISCYRGGCYGIK